MGTAHKTALILLGAMLAHVVLVTCLLWTIKHALVSPSGGEYDYNDFSCITDINECAMFNGNCSQVCTNTDGGYECSCSAGYQFDDDNVTCNGKPYLVQ